MKHNYSFLTITSIAMVTLALSGCGSDSNSKDEPCDGACLENQTCDEETNTCQDITTPSNPECTSNDDCTDGKICKDQKCVENTTEPECTSDDDCTDGKLCKDQKCVENTTEPECNYNSECDPDLICKDQKCVPECTTDDDCDGNLICKDQKCETECVIDDDCDGDLLCKDERCVPECETDNDCSGAMLCENGKCTESCSSNLDCDVDAGEICHEGECLVGCIADEDCDSGYCDNEACVECKSNDHCSDNFNGPHCAANHCVACVEDDNCDGNMVCTTGNTCEPLCTTDSDCASKNSALPYCLNADQADAATCVECTSDDQCAENYFCRENVCKVECESDIDCKDNKKCDTSDNKCYVCNESADCGNNLFCDAHECVTCATGDSDCDGILDTEDACPYNPSITKTKVEGAEEECNYVTDADGNQVFEIWHPLDFKRLQEEIERVNQETPSPTTCTTPADPAAPVLGECCEADQYTNTCASNKLLSCVEGIVTETTCDYGCDSGACLLCTEHTADTPYVAGNCCADDFAPVCESNKALKCVEGVVVEETCTNGCDGNACLLCTEHTADTPYVAGNCCADDFAPVCESNKAQKCIEGVIVEEACTYGCGETACNLCNVPTDETKLKVGDCCDAATFAQECSSDQKTSLQCIDGMVQEIACEMPCTTLDSAHILCASMPAIKIKARLMQDINIADALAAEDIQDVPFEALKVAWSETVTDTTTSETTTVTHDPDESGYTPYTITDDTCVARWNKDARIQLKNVELDGQNHRIFFKTADDKSCSMVDSLFSDVDNAYIHDLSLNYNVRGLIRSTFAQSINNSTIDNLSVIGNINLETKPALDEINANTYIQSNSLIAIAPYYYSVISSGSSDADNHFNRIQYKGNITQNFTLTSNTVTTKMIPGMSGLFNDLSHSTIQNSSVTVPDFVYTNGRSFVPFVNKSENNSAIYDTKVEIPLISGRSANTNVASSFVSGFAYEITKSIIGGNIDITLGNVSTPGNQYYGMAYQLSRSNILSDIHITAGDVQSVKNYYGVADYCNDSNYQGISVKTGSIHTGTRYFGIGYEFNGNHVQKNITIHNDSITSAEEFDGLSEKLSSFDQNPVLDGNAVLNGNIDIQIDGELNTKDYYGLARTLKAKIAGKTSIKLQNVTTGTSMYYGIAGTSNNSELNDIEITTGDLTYKNYFGLFNNPNGSTIKGTTKITTGNHTSSDTYIGLAFTVKPVTFEGDVTINTGDITAPTYYYGLGQEISDNGIVLQGKTNIETGDMTEMGPFFGLAKNIKGNAKDITIKYKNISQRYFSVSTYTTNFWGLAQTLSGDSEAQLTNVSLEIGNIEAPFYVSALFETCEAGRSADNIQVKTGDITIGTTNTYKGDFDGISRNMNGKLSNIQATFGNIYIMSGYRGYALGQKLDTKGEYKDIKVEIESMISESGRVGMVDVLNGSLENVAVDIHHLQTDAEQFSAITESNANASIKNLAYYADIYAKTPISSAFINDLRDAKLNLENIFIAARINTYTNTDSTTHKATNGIVYHGHPILFNALPDAAVSIVDDNDPKNILYNLDLTKTKNVFWLKRHDNDFASEKNFMSINGDPQFRGYRPNATEYALQSGTSEFDPDATLSGCQYTDASCDTPWIDADHMKSITEPHGDTITIPWLK